MRLIRPLMIAALTLGGLLATTENASAAFTVTISGTGLFGGTQTFSDGGTGFIDLNNFNQGGFGGSAQNGAYTINAEFQLVTTASTAQLQINFLSFFGNSNANITNLQIQVRDTNLNVLSNMLTSSLSLDTGAPSQTVTLDTNLSNPNTDVIATSSLGTTVVKSTLVSPVAPYTLTTTYTTSVTGHGSFSLDGSFGELSATPAPPTALFGVAGLPLLGLMRVIRRRKTQAATV